MPRKNNYKIKSGAHTFEVCLVDREILEDVITFSGMSVEQEKELNGNNGDISDYKNTDKFYWGGYVAPDKIYLLDTLKDASHEIATLLHEVLEMWDNSYDLDLDHVRLCLISELFTGLLFQNKKLFIDILNEQGEG